MNGIMSLKNPAIVDAFIWKEDLEEKKACDQHIALAKAFFQVMIIALSTGAAVVEVPGLATVEVVAEVAAGTAKASKSKSKGRDVAALGINSFGAFGVIVSGHKNGYMRCSNTPKAGGDIWNTVICPDHAVPPEGLKTYLLNGLDNFQVQSTAVVKQYLEDHWIGVKNATIKSKLSKLGDLC